MLIINLKIHLDEGVTKEEANEVAEAIKDEIYDAEESVADVFYEVHEEE